MSERINFAQQSDREAIARDHGVRSFGVEGWKIDNSEPDKSTHWTDEQQARMAEGFSPFAQKDVYRDDGQRRPDESVHWTEGQQAQMSEVGGPVGTADPYMDNGQRRLDESVKWTDEQKAQMSEVGGPVGVVNPYMDNGQRRPDESVHWTDEQQARMAEGFSPFKRSDGKEMWGTSEAEQQKLAQELLRADWVKDPNAALETLPDDTVVMIVGQRYKNIANRIDKDSFQLNTSQAKRQELGARLDCDLAIIASLIGKDRLVDGKKFDTALYMGEEQKNDMMGVLSSYENALRELSEEIPLVDGQTKALRMDTETGAPCNSLSVISRMKEHLKSRENEPLDDTRNGFLKMAEEVDDFETHMAKMVRE